MSFWNAAAMPSLTAGEIAYCSAVLLFSYSLRGSSGFGSAIGMPLLALVIPIKILAPAWTLLGAASSITILGRDRGHISYRELLAVAPWCAIGIGAGLYFFKTLDAGALAHALGVLILAYALYSFWQTLASRAAFTLPSRMVRPSAGVLSGAVGTMFGTMASVFFAIHLHESQLPKRAFRATMSAMLLALSIVRAIAYTAVGELGPEAMTVFVAALPAMLLGIYLGDRFHTGLSEVSFKRLLCAALSLCGLALLFQ